MLATVAAFSFMLLSGVIMQQAFGHASTTLTLTEDPVVGKKIRVVLGHTNEPTFGAKPGIHDGKHNMEVFLSDSDTRLPLAGASLKADMYYFKDIKAFNKATSPDDATEKRLGVAVGSVFGDPGHYLIREVQKDGIYGYRLYGTINYFGEGSIGIDSTIFCRSSEGDTSKFNSPGWSGSYGCTEEIDDILFPEKNEDVNPSPGKSGEKGKSDEKGASLGIEANDERIQQVAETTSTLNAVPGASATGTGAQQPSIMTSPSMGLQLLAFGIPAAAAASFFGIRMWRQNKRDHSL